jgi:hypothetical protein
MLTGRQGGGVHNGVALSRQVVAIIALVLGTAYGVGVRAQEAGGDRARPQPLVLEREGSFSFGGTVITGADGNTFHGDHGFAFFQIPPNAKQLPLVMWHGHGEFSKTWESTPDGREGYQQIFTRRGWATYVIDQPRRGGAGRTTVGITIPDAVPDEASFFTVLRLGTWFPPGPPHFFPNTQFPQDSGALDQYWRQVTPSTGPEPIDSATRALQGGAVAALFRQIGPGVLITHSNSGQYGWTTGMLVPDLVEGIIAYEPAAFAFPADEAPPSVETPVAGVAKVTAPQLVSRSEFDKLARIHIQIIYGDNIAPSPSSVYGAELWRVAVERAQQFVSAVNRHGGDAEILFLPSVGLHGNTHFPFSDRNNVQVADLLSQYLHRKGLDSLGSRQRVAHDHTKPMKGV